MQPQYLIASELTEEEFPDFFELYLKYQSVMRKKLNPSGEDILEKGLEGFSGSFSKIYNPIVWLLLEECVGEYYLEKAIADSEQTRKEYQSGKINIDIYSSRIKDIWERIQALSMSALKYELLGHGGAMLEAKAFILTSRETGKVIAFQIGEIIGEVHGEETGVKYLPFVGLSDSTLTFTADGESAKPRINPADAFAMKLIGIIEGNPEYKEKTTEDKISDALNVMNLLTGLQEYSYVQGEKPTYREETPEDCLNRVVSVWFGQRALRVDTYNREVDDWDYKLVPRVSREQILMEMNMEEVERYILKGLIPIGINQETGFVWLARQVNRPIPMNILEQIAGFYSQGRQRPKEHKIAEALVRNIVGLNLSEEEINGLVDVLSRNGEPNSHTELSKFPELVD